jgi:hypothetical protein
MEEFNAQCAVRCEYPMCLCPESGVPGLPAETGGEANPAFVSYVVSMQECSVLLGADGDMGPCARSDACRPNVGVHTTCESADDGSMACTDHMIEECQAVDGLQVFWVSFMGDICPTQMQACRTTGGCMDLLSALMAAGTVGAAGDLDSDAASDADQLWDSGIGLVEQQVIELFLCAELRQEPGFPVPMDYAAGPFCDDDELAAMAWVATGDSLGVAEEVDSHVLFAQASNVYNDDEAAQRMALLPQGLANNEQLYPEGCAIPDAPAGGDGPPACIAEQIMPMLEQNDFGAFLDTLCNPDSEAPLVTDTCSRQGC